MKKLTKKQADWLIERIQHDFGGWSGLPIEQCMPDLKRCINQCTEKEFPEFNGEAEEDEICIVLSKYKTAPIRVAITIKTNPDNDNDCVYFKAHEFKQFTAGCNKVVEWLEEQE